MDRTVTVVLSGNNVNLLAGGFAFDDRADLATMVEVLRQAEGSLIARLVEVAMGTAEGKAKDGPTMDDEPAA